MYYSHAQEKLFITMLRPRELGIPIGGTKFSMKSCPLLLLLLLLLFVDQQCSTDKKTKHKWGKLEQRAF